MKEEMSNFDIAAITPEINQIIKGTRIDNVYQINHTTILLRLRQPRKPRVFLLIEAGKRLHITAYTLETPKKPSNFCMALRKHIKNGEVTDFHQHDFERTVVIKVNTREGEFLLVSELFGGGNIILLNPQKIILQALTFRKMRDRKVWRGEPFQFAPQKGKNPLNLDRQDLSEIKGFGPLEIVRGLTKFLNMGGFYAEEILLRSQIDKNTPCEALTEQDLNRVFDQLREITDLITTGAIKPCIVLDDEKRGIDVIPIPLKKYEGLKRRPYKTFNEALDDYYTTLSSKLEAADVTVEVDQELARQKRVLQSQQKALGPLKETAEKNKKIGDVIYMHFNELQYLLQKIIRDKKNGAPWAQITSKILKEKNAGQAPYIYFKSLDPERLILSVSVENMIFSLDLRRSIQVNAADYYTKAKKAENKLEGAKKALQASQTRFENIRRHRIHREKEKIKSPIKTRKKEWYEKFRWFYSSDGFLVIGGRDAITNEILIKIYTEPKDIVFHTDIPGAPFVLIKTEGKNPSDQTISEAAQLGASYSRAWKEGLGAANVYWVLPKQVSKSPPSGQYIKKGSFIISGQKNYVRNVPLRVAIGIKIDKDQIMVIGGPPEAITNQTNNYVKIIPGDQTSSNLAKQIRELLSKKAPEILKKQIHNIRLEEIQKFIPSGKGKIP